MPGPYRASFLLLSDRRSELIIPVDMIDALLVIAFFFIGHRFGTAFFSGMLESGVLNSMAAVEALAIASAVLLVLLALLVRYSVRFLLLFFFRKPAKKAGGKVRRRK